MDRVSKLGGLVQFATTEEDGAIRESVFILRDNYKDFGSPKVITITIEPGDKLND